MTYRLTAGPGRDLFLKIADSAWWPRPRDEAARIEWAGAHLPVPRALESGSNGRVEWLITEALDGRNAAHPTFRADPPALVRIVAAGLRRLHLAPAEACPFDFRLDAALELARRRVEVGELDPERDFHSEHRHLSASAAIRRLEDMRPVEEAVVVCHGDYCLPNVLIDAAEVVGFVDLGELGIADRWWDLAVATWSLEWNLGPGYSDSFLEHYGVEPDRDRIAFYRLLYDVVS